MPKMLKSLHGRAFGLGYNNELIVNGTPQGKPADSVVRSFGLQITSITTGQVAALNATPQTIVTAPGAGKIAILEKIYVYKAADAWNAVGAADDLVARYTGASGAQVSAAIEGVGFLDNAAALLSYAPGLGAFGTLGTTTATGFAPGGVLGVANAAIVLHVTTGEVGTGGGALTVHAYYDVISVPLVTS